MRSDRYKEEPKPRKRNTSLKVWLIVIAILLVLIAGLTAYSYKSAKNSISLNLKDNDFSVEYGSRIPSMDYVANAVGEVAPRDEYFDTDSLGDKEMVYTVSKPILGGLLRPSGEYTLRYKVIDDIPPVLIRSGDGAVVVMGDEFDINTRLAYGDNADTSPSVNIEGEVDTNTPGEYTLHITLSDASGNRTEKDISVEVIDLQQSEEEEETEEDNHIGFTEFAETYKGDGKSFGIDVSEWQGEIDFEAVKAAGCEFVIIRIGYSRNGEVTVDSNYDRNIKAAKAAGLKVGVYLFSYDKSVEEVRSSAKWVAEKLDGISLDLPAAFDWEDFGEFQNYGMNFVTLNRLYDTFSEVLGAAGYDTMLYSSKIYLEDIWEDTDIRPVWLAHYADETDYKGQYMLWQASCTGNIDGINGDVDLDILIP